MINPSQIQKHMHVLSSGNELLGAVDRVSGPNLKLKRDAVGQHHFVPLAWIDHVDDNVHLTRSARDVERLWTGEPFA